MATTEIAVSTPNAIVCAHCGNPILQSGVLGGWIVRTCHDRNCRDRSDGAWNMILRVGDAAISVALPRRFARAICNDMGDKTELIAAAGIWWHGPTGAPK